jgi:hypothetical protein
MLFEVYLHSVVCKVFAIFGSNLVCKLPGMFSIYIWSWQIFQSDEVPLESEQSGSEVYRICCNASKSVKWRTQIIALNPIYKIANLTLDGTFSFTVNVLLKFEIVYLSAACSTVKRKKNSIIKSEVKVVSTMVDIVSAVYN